ncbi:MAG: glutathione S-transferase family protein [Pseudomonadota bacterium]
MRVYGDLTSGNCWKVKALANRLGLDYAWEEVSAVTGTTREPWFLELNPAGQIPVVVFDDGSALAQSNAILLHLGETSPFVPNEPFGRAKMLEWLFWEQYSHEPYIAVCRLHMVFAGGSKATRAPERVTRGEAALDLMEGHLREADWLAASRPTLADLALVAYTRLADEGGFDLATRPAVGAWIDRTLDAFGGGTPQR